MRRGVLGLLFGWASVLGAGAPSFTQAQTSPQFSIDFYVIGAGGASMKSSCFRLSGTVGQTAPGYSSGSIDSLIAGYWQPATNAASDEIFYNGFEGCST